LTSAVIGGFSQRYLAPGAAWNGDHPPRPPSAELRTLTYGGHTSGRDLRTTDVRLRMELGAMRCEAVDDRAGLATAGFTAELLMAQTFVFV